MCAKKSAPLSFDAKFLFSIFVFFFLAEFRATSEKGGKKAGSDPSRFTERACALSEMMTCHALVQSWNSTYFYLGTRVRDLHGSPVGDFDFFRFFEFGQFFSKLPRATRDASE